MNFVPHRDRPPTHPGALLGEDVLPALGMPIQTAHEGYITKNRASYYSAEIANAVVDDLLETRTTWKNQGAVFCIELKIWMQDEVRKQYPNLGAIVNQ